MTAARKLMRRYCSDQLTWLKGSIICDRQVNCIHTIKQCHYQTGIGSLSMFYSSDDAIFWSICKHLLYGCCKDSSNPCSTRTRNSCKWTKKLHHLMNKTYRDCQFPFDNDIALLFCFFFITHTKIEFKVEFKRVFPWWHWSESMPRSIIWADICSIRMDSLNELILQNKLMSFNRNYQNTKP